jgi:excisionase family DNA binding protein
MKPNRRRKLVKKTAAAERLGVSIRTIERMIHDSRLPTVRMGGSVRIPADALEKAQEPKFRVSEARVVRAEGSLLINSPGARNGSDDDEIFEPFFQDEPIGLEAKRRQTVQQRMKWSLYYQKWGCLVCQTKKAPHMCMGMCAVCQTRTRWRLRQLVEQAEEDLRQQEGRFVRDLTGMAQSALRSAIAERALGSDRTLYGPTAKVRGSN